MSNQFLTPVQAAKELLDNLHVITGGDERKLRALIYDFQTAIGGFPSSKAERDRYIKRASRVPSK